MRKTLLIMIAFSLFPIMTFGQREQFDCNSMNNAKLVSAYNQLKSYGLEYKIISKEGVTKDIMEFAIYFLKPAELQQICINAWGEVEYNGSDYCYNKFVKIRGHVPRSVFNENLDYFVILSMIRDLVGDDY